jgi:hypothetical protein
MSQFPVPVEAAQAARAAEMPLQHPGSLASIIRRIEDAIDVETAGIRENLEFDIAASNARKSRYLYELSKAAGALSQRQLGDEHRESLQRLRAKLEVNERVILAHLGAVKEVADLLQGAIQRAEADGTYSASEFGRF